MLILYTGRLKMVFEAALRPLKSIKAKSCYTLNGRAAHELFIHDANLLDYVGEVNALQQFAGQMLHVPLDLCCPYPVGKYEMIGVTGVGKWIHGDEEGPSCDRHGIREYNAVVRGVL